MQRKMLLAIAKQPRQYAHAEDSDKNSKCAAERRQQDARFDFVQRQDVHGLGADLGHVRGS